MGNQASGRQTLKKLTVLNVSVVFFSEMAMAVRARLAVGGRTRFSFSEIFLKMPLFKHFKIRLYQCVIALIVQYGCETITF